MNITEILNIVNEPSKHIQIVKIDGKDSIVYSSKFVELLELIPTMLTKADMVAMLDEIRAEIQKEENIWYHDCEPDFSKDFDVIRVDTVLSIIDKYRESEGKE